LAMAEAFSAVLEAARRTTGRSYHDFDIMAGAALYSGRAVQSDDNGCNHFAALLAVYLCAALREHVHYVTTTAALTRHGHQEVEAIYAALGLRSRFLPGTSVSSEDPEPVTEVDVTYGSYQKMAAEYLGQHLAPGPGLADHKHQFAIIDQIDSILVDQANVPMVIRAPKPPNADFFRKMAATAAELKRGRDYEIDRATGALSLSSEGWGKGAALLGIDSSEGLSAAGSKRFLEDALRAREWYRRSKDYQVVNARVIISTGSGSRLHGLPRLQEGILQAIEAREGLATSPEMAVWARMTVSDYFRTYTRLAGISGVAAHAGLELERIYGLATVTIPGSGSSVRIDRPDLIFERSRARFQALAEEAANRHRIGQPVVIGVVTDADSLLVGRVLAERKIAFRALHSGDEEAAFETMAQAGGAGSVTILTAEVARGCDVPLGRADTSQASPEPSAGLAVLAAGRNRSRRRDRWLRGLAGRRGEPGESQFFLSLEDPLLRGLQSRVWDAMPTRIRRKADGMPLGGVQVRVIDGIQRETEQADSQRRGHQFAVDEVESAQRSQIYSLIEELASKSDLKDFVDQLIDEVATIYVRRYSDPDRLLSALSMLYPVRLTMDELVRHGADAGDGAPHAGREEKIRADAHAAYSRLERFIGAAVMRESERRVVFSVLTRSWSQHLSELDAMHAAAHVDDGSHDRLAEYQTEATKRYTAMLEKMKEDIVGYLFHTQPRADR